MVRRYLRRFRFTEKEKCGTDSYCNAQRVLDDVPFASQMITIGKSPFHEDDVPPLSSDAWPKVCERCGRAFTADDVVQVNARRLYFHPVLQRPVPWEEAPSGSMIDVWWYPAHWRGPDGRSLMVKLPTGEDWAIDLPATNTKQPWTRTGNIPNVTARPSILTEKFHGFLTNGVIAPC